MLHRHGIAATKVVGATPGRSSASDFSRSAADDGEYTDRAGEIKGWLASHPEVERFVIIDDRGSASDRDTAAHFVQPDTKQGLSEADVQRAMEILAAPMSGALRGALVELGGRQMGRCVEVWDALGGTCPCSQAVRIALTEKRVPYNHRAEVPVSVEARCGGIQYKLCTGRYG